MKSQDARSSLRTAIVLETLAGGGQTERMMTLQWQLAGWLEVERRPPHMTAGGKMLHRHEERPTSQSAGGDVAC